MNGRMVLIILTVAVVVTAVLLWNMEHSPTGIRPVQAAPAAVGR
jgi:hypothetical protein